MCEPVPKHHALPPANRGSLSSQTLERAALALRKGHFAEAERLAGEVLRRSRTDAVAVSMLARALIAQNRGGERLHHSSGRHAGAMTRVLRPYWAQHSAARDAA